MNLSLFVAYSMKKILPDGWKATATVANTTIRAKILLILPRQYGMLRIVNSNFVLHIAPLYFFFAFSGR
jgi:hypothetical protein